MKAFLNMAKQVARQIVKKIVKAIVKKILLALSPVAIGLLLAIFFIAAFYSAMPQEKTFTGVEASEQDTKIRKKIKTAVNVQNVADYYIVPGEKSEGSWYESGGAETEKVDYLLKNGVVRYMDNNGRDAELANTWGDVFAILMYENAQKNRAAEYSPNKIDKLTKDLHPYFYVKRSEIIRKYPVEQEDGSIKMETDVNNIFLLVEAKTIRGWYQYNYDWKTTHYDDGGIKKYEAIKQVMTLEPKWEWFSNYLIDYYKFKPDEKAATRELVVNASEAFSGEKEWLDWLLSYHGNMTWASNTMIPGELMNFFQEAESIYGIPWWFLAAAAFRESSFNPLAENESSGCYGLMQVSPSNWATHAPQLGFDVAADRDNPRAQIIVGTYMLNEAGLKRVDWNGDWKEPTLPVLTFYGGFRGLLAKERCREEYASDIWELAERFQNVKTGWPVQGEITSPFGWRIILGVRDYHEGIDIGAATGTPITSVSGGVLTTGYQADGAGNYIYIRDGYYEYAYYHLADFAVSDGDTIQPGQIIGYVGSTGRSSGPHLHFGVRTIGGSWINPLNILP